MYQFMLYIKKKAAPRVTSVESAGHAQAPDQAEVAKSFTRYENKHCVGHNELVGNTIYDAGSVTGLTLTECAQRCYANPTDVCTSFEYSRWSTGKCQLSRSCTEWNAVYSEKFDLYVFKNASTQAKTGLDADWTLAPKAPVQVVPGQRGKTVTPPPKFEDVDMIKGLWEIHQNRGCEINYRGSDRDNFKAGTLAQCAENCFQSNECLSFAYVKKPTSVGQCSYSQSCSLMASKPLQGYTLYIRKDRVSCQLSLQSCARHNLGSEQQYTLEQLMRQTYTAALMAWWSRNAAKVRSDKITNEADQAIRETSSRPWVMVKYTPSNGRVHLHIEFPMESPWIKAGLDAGSFGEAVLGEIKAHQLSIMLRKNLIKRSCSSQMKIVLVKFGGKGIDLRKWEDTKQDTSKQDDDVKAQVIQGYQFAIDDWMKQSRRTCRNDTSLLKVWIYKSVRWCSAQCVGNPNCVAFAYGRTCKSCTRQTACKLYDRCSEATGGTRRDPNYDLYILRTYFKQDMAAARNMTKHKVVVTKTVRGWGQFFLAIGIVVAVAAALYWQMHKVSDGYATVHHLQDDDDDVDLDNLGTIQAGQRLSDGTLHGESPRNTYPRNGRGDV